MKHLAVTLASLSLLASASAEASGDVRSIAPALEKYTQERLLGEVWKRPGSRRGTAASSRSPR
jgi:4-carboxymuconolactone decarboxylase